MNPLLPAGVSRRVSQPAPLEYPSNCRSFVHLDARLLPYWHALFDICPALLKLDPPEGLNLFRSFMTWAYRNQPPLDWSYHLNVCRWLLSSPYRAQIDHEPIEAFMAAAAARWVNTDESQTLGIVVAWQASTVVDWKDTRLSRSELHALAQPPWDFAWSPLIEQRGFSGWLPVP